MSTAIAPFDLIIGDSFSDSLAVYEEQPRPRSAIYLDPPPDVELIDDIGPIQLVRSPDAVTCRDYLREQLMVHTTVGIKATVVAIVDPEIAKVIFETAKLNVHRNPPEVNRLINEITASILGNKTFATSRSVLLLSEGRRRLLKDPDFVSINPKPKRR